MVFDDLVELDTVHAWLEYSFLDKCGDPCFSAQSMEGCGYCSEFVVDVDEDGDACLS